jgi:hypothetical protein
VWRRKGVRNGPGSRGQPAGWRGGGRGATVADDDAPAAISIIAGDNQRARVGTAYATALAVDVRDAAGGLVQGVSVTFTAPPQDGPSGTFAGSSTVLTNAAGRASAPAFTANVIAGAYAVTATAGAVEASFSLTNTPGPVWNYYIYPGSEGAREVTQGVPFDIYILPFDEFFNWITDYAGLVEFYTLDPLGTVPPAYTFTGTEGGIGVPGQVILGSLGRQELYCWDAATITVFGWATYNVLAPGGSPGPGRQAPPDGGLPATIRAVGDDSGAYPLRAGLGNSGAREHSGGTTTDRATRGWRSRCVGDRPGEAVTTVIDDVFRLYYP